VNLSSPSKNPQEQAVRLQLIYTVATSAFCFCVWPTGLVLDNYGPRACCMMGSVFFGLGCGLFGMSSNDLDLFLPGFTLMAIGGLPVVLSMMHLSELLPSFAGTIMTIFNVMIDVSSLDLQLFRVMVTKGICTRQEAFTYYMIVPIAIFVTAPLLWPNCKYEQAQQTDMEDVVLDSPRAEAVREAAGKKEELASRKHYLKSAPFSVQMMSKEFIFCTLFTALQLLHINLYIGTVDDQLNMLPFPNVSSPATNSSFSLASSANTFLVTEQVGTTSTLTVARSMEVHWFGSGRSLSGAEGSTYQMLGGGGASQAQTAADLCAAFAWILPLGGLAMTYPVGAILDNLALSAAMFMLSLAALIHSVFAMAIGPLASPAMQMVGFVVFAYYRAALFGTMATTVAFAFGHGNFGKLWGLLYIVSGCLNFGIAPLAMLAKTLGSYASINATTLAISAVLMGYSFWLRQEERLDLNTSYPAARQDLIIHSDYGSHHSGFGNDEYSSHSHLGQQHPHVHPHLGQPRGRSSRY